MAKFCGPKTTIEKSEMCVTLFEDMNVCISITAIVYITYTLSLYKTTEDSVTIVQ